ncbi:unnamed protein product [Vitrella brassicaformis CCMP3155]|uniref:T6SS Phospholipase effector Tle1-like catalytic domain-containing protein n=1 Tax=Vitrella brassicaformis (strain CCMP3155) TaxID=1169540 RepID=A0A0G4H4S1_VITBC|nr:unnamed protein product [Vitrella brassicaformis CCMP3155]|eukprot:CEM38790.1 unnamed protein product [Vitrella brassicaformis CCMP3155]
MMGLAFCSAFLFALQLGTASSICQEADCEVTPDWFISADESETSADLPRNVIVLFDGSGKNRDRETPKEWGNIPLIADSIDPFIAGGQQLVKYHRGVGREKFSEPKELFAFMTGAGFVKSVLDAIEWLMDIGLTKEDRLFMFGFSRGALQARLLQGLLFTFGLPADKKNELAFLQEKKSDLVQKFAYLHEDGPGTEYMADDERKRDTHFVGLFDAVADTVALLYNVQRLVLDIAPTTKYVYHAMSLDELRGTFEAFPITFDPSAYATSRPTNRTAKAQVPHIENLWFEGDHKDVGGGLDDIDRIADIPLRWMLQKAESAGLKLTANWQKSIPPYMELVAAKAHNESKLKQWQDIQWQGPLVGKVWDDMRKQAVETRPRWAFKCSASGGNVLKMARPLLHRSVLDRFHLRMELPRPLCCQQFRLLDRPLYSDEKVNEPTDHVANTIRFVPKETRPDGLKKYDIETKTTGGTLMIYHVLFTPAEPAVPIKFPDDTWHAVSDSPTCQDPQLLFACCVRERMRPTCSVDELQGGMARFKKAESEREQLCKGRPR